MARETDAQRYGKALRGRLEAKGVSIRKLGKLLDPEHPETSRSNVHRYLRGQHLPRKKMRRRIAQAIAEAQPQSSPENLPHATETGKEEL